MSWGNISSWYCSILLLSIRSFACALCLQLVQLQSAVAEKEKASRGYDSALEKADKTLSDTRSSLDLLPSDQSSSAAIAAQITQLKVNCAEVFQAKFLEQVYRL